MKPGRRIYIPCSGKSRLSGIVRRGLSLRRDRYAERAENPEIWQAVWLENDYIKVMILPELGGRVHRAWDKVKQRDFVYHNEVIKPALVGLLGPWISGGIEFNWPQHHRPTTFMPVDFTLEAHEDGAQTVWVGETEPMHGLQVMTGFTLRPDRAALEIASRVYNGNATPRHFLWWANPAVKGVKGIRASSAGCNGGL